MSDRLIGWCEGGAVIGVPLIRDFYRAIEETRNRATLPLLRQMERVRERPEGFSADYCEALQDEYWSAEQLCGVMYGALAVAASSLVENTLVEMNELAGERYESRTPGRADLLKHFERRYGVNHAMLPGSEGQGHVHLLGNCFKHNDGCFNDAAARALQATVGDRIPWVGLPWPQLICDVSTFVQAICKCGRRVEFENAKDLLNDADTGSLGAPPCDT